MGLILLLPHVWVQGLYLQGFPEGYQGGRLKRAKRNLPWGWGKLNLTERAGDFNTCSKFVSGKGPQAVLELFLACSFPTCYLHPHVHLCSTCGLRDVLCFRRHLHLALLQGSVTLGLNLSSRRYFAGGLGNRGLQITVRACKNASCWVNAGGVTLTLWGLDSDQSQGSSRSKVI